MKELVEKLMESGLPVSWEKFEFDFEGEKFHVEVTCEGTNAGLAKLFIMSQILIEEENKKNE